MEKKARKSFLLRINPKVMAAVERLAANDLRSANAQIEILLTEALKKRGINVQNNGIDESS